MQIPPEQIKAAQELATSGNMGDGPMPFVLLMASLISGEPIQAGTTRAVTKDGVTTWRALWVTPSRVVYGEASRKGTWWNNSTDDANSTKGWSVPLSSLASIAVTGSRSTFWSEEKIWTTLCKWEIDLGHDRVLRIPLEGQGGDGYGNDADEALVRFLLSRPGQ